VSLMTTTTYCVAEGRGVKVIKQVVVQKFLIETDLPSLAQFAECCQWDLPIMPQNRSGEFEVRTG